MKQLRELLGGISPLRVLGSLAVEVSGIAYDSREVAPGDVFVAQRGRQFDGSAFLEEAVARGAVAIVGEASSPRASLTVPYLAVHSASLALSRLSAAFYDFPARQLQVVGVTGTDGKTTTVHMISSILECSGRRAGRISTVDLAIGGTVRPNTSDHTTPQAPDIQRTLREMLDTDARFAVIEASSHSLVRHRVADCEFDVAVLTNLSPEHLDFHETFARYRDDKATLFRLLGEPNPKRFPRFGVVNADDPEAPYFAYACPVPVVSYGIQAEADVRASEIEEGPWGTRFAVLTRGKRFRMHTSLIGSFNVQNWLAASATALGLGVAPEAVVRAAAEFRPVPGRMQLVDRGQPFSVVVDFAHTPNALAVVLSTLRARTPGRLVVVFGHPGGRDTANRPKMARAAAKHSERFIITSDDPYDEEPAAIIAQIEAGASEMDMRRGVDYLVIEDRREAIAHALADATPGDTVLIAGRGHERYMAVAGQKLPFDDAAVAAELLSGLGGR